jgi:hypothetical protein
MIYWLRMRVCRFRMKKARMGLLAQRNMQVQNEKTLNEPVSEIVFAGSEREKPE